MWWGRALAHDSFKEGNWKYEVVSLDMLHVKMILICFETILKDFMIQRRIIFLFLLVKVLVKPEKKYWSADKVLEPISGPLFFSVILSYFSLLSSLIFQCDVRQSIYFSFTSVSSLKRNYPNCFLCILIFIYNIIWHIYILMHREYRKASQQKYFWTKYIIPIIRSP